MGRRDVRGRISNATNWRQLPGGSRPLLPFQSLIFIPQNPPLWDGPPLFPGIGYDAGVRRGKERTDVYCDPWYRSRQELVQRSEEHTSELQSLMRISYAVFCM